MNAKIDPCTTSSAINSNWNVCMHDEYHRANMTTSVGMRNGMYGCYFALFLYQISYSDGIFSAAIAHSISLSLSLCMHYFSMCFRHSEIVLAILIDNKRGFYFRSINFHRMLWNFRHFVSSQNMPSTDMIPKREEKIEKWFFTNT